MSRHQPQARFRRALARRKVSSTTRLTISSLVIIFTMAFVSMVIARRSTSGKSDPAIAHTQNIKINVDPPGTIDGSKNPELIPDEVAFRLIFLAIAEPENAPEARKTLARAKIRPIGLDESDTLIFLAATGDFKKRLDALDAQAASIHSRVFLPRPGTKEWDQLMSLNAQAEATARNIIDTRSISR